MKNIFIVIGFLIAITAAWSCKKNVQDPTFTGESRIFWAGSSNIDFSFATVPSTQTDTVITLTAQVVGNIVDYDRTFAVTVVDTSSSVFPDEYEFISDFKIPANSFRGTLGVRLKRTERLADTEAVLVIRLVDTDDFLSNATLQTSFSLTWTNQMVKPALWDGQFGILNFIGFYSKTKHQLIIDLTPFPDFEIFLTSATYNNQKYAIQGILAEYVGKYNLERQNDPSMPPLLNDDGQPIQICRQCP